MSSPAGRRATVSEPELHAHRLVGLYRRGVLDPVERTTEIIFGLMMVVTFTGTYRIAEGGQQQLRGMLVAALGCNIAWGIVDGAMYVLTSTLERSRRIAVLRGVRAASSEGARAIVLGALPDGIRAAADGSLADEIVDRIRALPGVPFEHGFEAQDLAGGLACAVLTIAATLPPTLPFLLMADVRQAVIASGVTAVACLFVAGWQLARATGVRAWPLAVGMVLLGVALEAVTIALGG